SNMRNLVGCAPDNHYGSSLKLMAVLHDFGTIMQEDSMPESADAFRHLTFRSQSLFFTARTHWESNFDARLGHAAAGRLPAAAARRGRVRTAASRLRCAPLQRG
ncbi:MAG: hypothetical protein WCP30_00455, partial [Mycobacteriaceae bacterium]